MEKPFDIESMDRKLPFSVPKGYFEQFAKDMDARIAEQVRSKRRGHQFRWIYAAAVFFGLLVGSFIVYVTRTGTAQPVIVSEKSAVDSDAIVARQFLLEDVSEEVLVEYILANADEQ